MDAAFLQDFRDAVAEGAARLLALPDAAVPALKATESRDPKALLDAGEGIDTACENCHLKYWYPLSKQAEKAKEGAGSVKEKK